MTNKITFTVDGERHELPIDGSKTPRVGSVSPEHKLTVTGSFVPTPSIAFTQHDTSVMTIHSDGRITLGDDAKPTEAAAACIEAMGAMIETLVDNAVKAERAAIVAWLRSHRGGSLTWRERLVWAWWSLRHGELIGYAMRHAAGNFIEEGEHLKEPKS